MEPGERSRATVARDEPPPYSGGRDRRSGRGGFGGDSWSRSRSGRPSMLSALLLVQARRLALQRTQVVQARAANLTVAQHLDPVYAWAVNREHALDADTVAHLPYREHGASLALPVSDDDALEDLDALLVTLLDLRVDADGVARADPRQGGPG